MKVDGLRVHNWNHCLSFFKKHNNKLVVATMLLPKSVVLVLATSACWVPSTTAFIPPGFHLCDYPTTSSSAAGALYRSSITPWTLLKEGAIGKSDTQQPEENKEDYKDRLAKLDQAIASAEEERQQLLQRELDRYNNKKNHNASNDYDEDNDVLVPVDKWKPRELKRPTPSLSLQEQSQTLPQAALQTKWQQPPQQERSFTTRSQISRSDAGTLVIEITPQGITSGTLFNGAFSVAWFSAVVPATLTALSGGLLGMALFMVPFWAAGGMIAKQAIVDPFISYQLTVGEYAWSIESKYGGGANKRAPTIKKQDGSTQDLQGAKVEISVVVNDVPQYHLCLYSNKKGVTHLGLGLPPEELEKVAMEINEYLDKLKSSE